MVITMSGDGILVSDKERSGRMKSYVEQLDGGRCALCGKVYTVIDTQPGARTVKIRLKAGSNMKYHSHELRDEVLTVLSGMEERL